MASITKPILLDETYRAKMAELISAMTGLSKGALPVVQHEDYGAMVEISANIVNIFPDSGHDFEISFAPVSENLDHEWVFIIIQGEEARTVGLPEIEWYLGIEPSFGANSITEVRVHRVGHTFRGVWSV